MKSVALEKKIIAYSLRQQTHTLRLQNRCQSVGGNSFFDLRQHCWAVA